MESYLWCVNRSRVVRAIVSLYCFFGGRMKAKMTVKIGYEHFVMDAEKALQLVNILHDAEMYRSKWMPAVDGNDSHTAHHVYPNETTSAIELGMLPDAAYAIAKIAGKPE